MPTGRTIATSVVAGIAAGAAGAVMPATGFAMAVAGLALAVGFDARAFRRVSLAIALCAAGIAHGAMARERALAPPLLVWFNAQSQSGRTRLDAPVEIEGRIARDASVALPGVRLLMDVVRIRDPAGWQPLSGRVQALVTGAAAPAHVADWTAGRSIRAPVILRAPQFWLNFGRPGAEWQQLQQRVDLTGTIKSAALVEVSRGHWWDELASAVRKRVRDAVDHAIGVTHPQSAAIVAAILIGDRAGLDDDVEQRLQVAGTYHVIAISGGNIALVVVVCLGLTRLITRRAHLGSLVTMAVVCAYGWIVGGEPSVARAVAAACVYLLAGLAGLTLPPVNTLMFVALVLAVVDPMMTMDVGAWLSFGATLGIVVWAGPIAGRLVPARFAQVRVVRAIATISAATIAAELMLLPIGAAIFSRVGVAGLALNLIAIPAMSVVELAGIAAVVCAGLSPILAGLVGFIAHLAATALVRSAELVDVVPWVSWRVPTVAPATLVLFYGGLALVLYVKRNARLRRGATALVAVAVVMLVTAPFAAQSRPPPGRLRLTMIDVGQGDAILVQFPSGQALLVDTGGVNGAFDIGGRVVTPAIWALGVTRLEWLAFTHPDLDHIGGAQSVARDLVPREIWEGIRIAKNRQRAELYAAAVSARLAWRTVQSGQTIEIGGAVVRAISPPAPDWERPVSRNDDSIVLRIEFGDVAFLLTGDAGREFEARPLDDLPAAKLRVLKVGHHGSRTSSSEPFLRAWRPDLSLISAGRGNLFGHPAPDVVSRLLGLGSEVVRTDRDGAVMVETDGRTIDVRTAAGRAWSIRADAR